MLPTRCSRGALGCPQSDRVVRIAPHPTYHPTVVRSRQNALPIVELRAGRLRGAANLHRPLNLRARLVQPSILWAPHLRGCQDRSAFVARPLEAMNPIWNQSIARYPIVTR